MCHWLRATVWHVHRVEHRNGLAPITSPIQHLPLACRAHNVVWGTCFEASWTGLQGGVRVGKGPILFFGKAYCYRGADRLK